MAEKEKRILITKCSSWCHALRISCDPFDDKDGMYCDKSGKWVRVTEKECAKCKDPVLLGISRQEAIERMAKEMARKYDPLKPNKEEYESVWEHELLPSTQKHFKELAEAALNALLSQEE